MLGRSLSLYENLAAGTLRVSCKHFSMQDGTVNVHTIQEGQYVRTLEPVGCDGLRTQITFLALSSQGHVAFSATDKVQDRNASCTVTVMLVTHCVYRMQSCALSDMLMMVSAITSVTFIFRIHMIYSTLLASVYSSSSFCP
jgi:hypothetical protein